jgi:hypothetical protein
MLSRIRSPDEILLTFNLKCTHTQEDENYLGTIITFSYSILCKLERVAFPPNLPDKRRWQPRNASRVHPNYGNVSRFRWPGTRHVTASFPRNGGGVARNASDLLALRHPESETISTWNLRVSLSPKTSPRKRIGTRIRVRLPACCLEETYRDAKLAKMRCEISWPCGIAGVGLGL